MTKEKIAEPKDFDLPMTDNRNIIVCKQCEKCKYAKEDIVIEGTNEIVEGWSKVMCDNYKHKPIDIVKNYFNCKYYEKNEQK